MSRETLLSYLHDFSRYSRRTCFLFDDGFRTWRYSYREILQSVDRFAARLQSGGVGQEDKVIFWCENRPEWIVAFWACLKLGAIVVPIDYRSSEEFVTRIHQIVQSKLLLRGEETIPVDLGIPVWKLSLQDGMCESCPAGAEFASPSPSSTVEIVFTSGTTGEPKGVVISHKNILANLLAVEAEIEKYRRYAWPVSPLRFLNLLPLSHMFGQVMAAFIPQMMGGVAAFQKGYNPRDIMALVRRERVSVLICVPKVLTILKEHVTRQFPETESAFAQSLPVYKRWWKYRRLHARFGFKFWAFVVGAAPLAREVEDFWSQLGFVVIQGYGLTETAPIVSLNHPFSTRRGSLGKPIGGLEVKLAEDGEILVRGENVTSGYYRAPDETARTFQDGWFHTGDIGEIDAEGRLYYRGRKKEMIVPPEGMNVFPEDVEKVLNSIEGVRESAVVGVPVDGEERVQAVVILDNERDLAEIQRLANEQLEEHQKIRGISAWPEKDFPRTEGTQKLKRREIRAWFEGKKTDTSPTAGTNTVEELLARLVGRPAEQVQEGMKLSEDLGLSSLERIELLGSLEKRFQVSLDDQLFSEVREVADLKRLLSTSRASVPVEPILKLPRWSLSFWARATRWLVTVLVVVPLTHRVARITVRGLESLPRTDAPVLFAANHQSHLDTPVIKCALPWKLRFRLAAAMAMEFFRAHFWSQGFSRTERLWSHLEYYLACLFFKAFPLPQRELAARQTLRYMGELVGEGNSLLVFPEGRRSPDGTMASFQPGVGLMASHLKIAVVPVRVEGTRLILPVGASRYSGWSAAWRVLGALAYKPRKPVLVAFGRPIYAQGAGYAEIVAKVEAAVRGLG